MDKAYYDRVFKNAKDPEQLRSIFAGTVIGIRSRLADKPEAALEALRNVIAAFKDADQKFD
jgi:hypothetical protein